MTRDDRWQHVVMCDCGCCGAVVHGIEMDPIIDGYICEVNIWSGGGNESPYTLWQRVKNAWRYLRSTDEKVYPYGVILRRHELTKLRDACSTVIDEMEEHEKQVLLKDKPSLETLYKQLQADNDADKAATVDELREALAIVRRDKMTNRP